MLVYYNNMIHNPTFDNISYANLKPYKASEKQLYIVVTTIPPPALNF